MTHADLIADAVAELCLALELLCLRPVREMDCGMRAGTPGGAARAPGELLRGKRVGLVGAGYVARKHLQLLKPFGCDAAVYDPFLSEAVAVARQRQVDLS